MKYAGSKVGLVGYYITIIKLAEKVREYHFLSRPMNCGGAVQQGGCKGALSVFVNLACYLPLFIRFKKKKKIFLLFLQTHHFSQNELDFLCNPS